MESSPKHRHRSHTIAARIGPEHCGESVMATQQALVAAHHETNLCGYDSYLHQTICAAANANHAALHLNGGVVANGGVFTALPVTTSTPNRLMQHHSHHAHAKAKR